MNDERRTIGTDGAAGRGTRGGSPSSGARSLAGGKAAPRKPVRKAAASATTESSTTKPARTAKPETPTTPTVEPTTPARPAPRRTALRRPGRTASRSERQASRGRWWR